MPGLLKLDLQRGKQEKMWDNIRGDEAKMRVLELGNLMKCETTEGSLKPREGDGKSQRAEGPKWPMKGTRRRTKPRVMGAGCIPTRRPRLSRFFFGPLLAVSYSCFNLEMDECRNNCFLNYFL